LNGTPTAAKSGPRLLMDSTGIRTFWQSSRNRGTSELTNQILLSWTSLQAMLPLQ